MIELFVRQMQPVEVAAIEGVGGGVDQRSSSAQGASPLCQHSTNLE